MLKLGLGSVGSTQASIYEHRFFFSRELINKIVIFGSILYDTIEKVLLELNLLNES